MGIFEHIATKRFRHTVALSLIGSIALVSLTLVCYRLRFNLATSGFLCVIVVVLLSRSGDFVSSIIVSMVAALCLAHLAPPAYSFRVDDPLDLVAIIAFLTTSLVIARLVSKLRKITEETLSSVNRRLIDSEEKERARVARELHDDILQRLALVAIELEHLQQDSSDRPAAVRARIDELHSETVTIITDIQSLAHKLHSSKLEYLGLAGAMRSFCVEFGRQQKVEIDFKSHDLPSPLPADVSLSLFRVLQEALHNSAKHSESRQVEVELFEGLHAIHLIVRDSGLGFNPEVAMKGSGLGLVSMRERIKLVKGEFSIDSQFNRGTTIFASAPLRRESNSAEAAG